MSDFDKDDYLSDADDLNRLSHQDGPEGPDAGEGTGDGSVPVAGARADSDAMNASSAADHAASGAAPDGTAQDDSASAAAHGADDAARTDKGAGAAPTPSDGTKAADGSLTELGKAKKEAADYLEALQRERADFINYRHRTAREKDDYRRRGQEDVLKALLPALDNLDRLREHGKMTKEVEAVAKQLDHGFDTFHITKFGTKGEAFDPARHEAILHRTSPDVDSVRVDAVVESGYELDGRILRAAKVVVVSPQEKTDAQKAPDSGAQTSQKPAEGGTGTGSASSAAPGTDTGMK